jgi:hypothetical protein
MYLYALKAVREHIEYDRMTDGRWRAAFKGAFDVSAEARSPEDARLDVETQIDKLVAAWIVRPPDRPRARRGPGRETNARRKSTSPGRRRMP